MAHVKVTFTFDEETIALLNQTAERLGKPKSEVVREAIADYHSRTDRLSEAERRRMLRIVRDLAGQTPTRPQREVDQEIRDLRRSRRAGWGRATDGIS